MSAQAGTDRRLVGEASATSVAEPWIGIRLKPSTPMYVTEEPPHEKPYPKSRPDRREP